MRGRDGGDGEGMGGRASVMGSALLRGERVRLTNLARADAATVASWYQDAEFMRLYDATAAFPKTVEEILATIEEAQRSAKEYLFAVRAVADDALIGQATIGGILWTHRVGWVSLALAPDYWGQRYGTEALSLLLQFAFQELNLRRLQLTVFDYNERALALYARAGFRHEGTYRQFLDRDGVRHDMLLMGLLVDEWRAAHGGGTPSTGT